MITVQDDTRLLVCCASMYLDELCRSAADMFIHCSYIIHHKTTNHVILYLVKVFVKVIKCFGFLKMVW